VKQNPTAYEDDQHNEGSHDPHAKKKIFALFVFLPLSLIVTHQEITRKLTLDSSLFKFRAVPISVGVTQGDN
jgi:hypothetical protein